MIHWIRRSRDLGVRAAWRLMTRRGLEEIDGVVVVLLDAGRDREDVRIENDVFRGKADRLGQQLVRPRADAGRFSNRASAACPCSSNAMTTAAGAVAACIEAGATQELRLAILERDGVDDAFALQALQAFLEDGPLRRIHHDRHLRQISGSAAIRLRNFTIVASPNR